MWDVSEERRQAYGAALHEYQLALQEKDAVYATWKGDTSTEADREREMARHRRALAEIAARAAAERVGNVWPARITKKDTPS